MKGELKMARPITATPKLNRKQTVEFITRLLENQDKKENICLRESVLAVRGKRDASRQIPEK